MSLLFFVANRLLLLRMQLRSFLLIDETTEEAKCAFRIGSKHAVAGGNLAKKLRHHN